jgi:AbiV family abortive infection protein
MNQLLLEGAVYALENCGALLRDAFALYRRGSHASAIVMTMFAREELGKYRILRDEFDKAAVGGTVDLADLVSKKGRLFNHTEKQEQAVLSIIQTADRDSPLGQLLRARMDLPVGSPEWEKAGKELDAITEAQKKALPTKRHKLRMDALYVGLNDTHTAWVRPQEVTAAEAHPEVYHAMGDYNNALSRLEMDVPEGNGFLKALYAWEDRPQLSAVNEWGAYER